MYASLPMYDWPESRAQTDATWSAVREAARAHAPAIALPPALSRPADIQAHWRDPALVFSQTCWGPLSRGLDTWLTVLVQPDYSPFEGGRGPWYRSALVAREGARVAPPDDPRAVLPPDALAGRRLAVNGFESLSGFLALQDDLGADPRDRARAVVLTGGHRASVIAVAEGQADIAAIDCRSWAMARRFEPCAARLRVIGWTAERAGLPYVTSRATDGATREALRLGLMDLGCHPAPEGGQRED